MFGIILIFPLTYSVKSLWYSVLWCLLTYPVLYLGKSIRRGLFKEGKKRLASPEYHTLQM